MKRKLFSVVLIGFLVVFMTAAAFAQHPASGQGVQMEVPVPLAGGQRLL